jgi:hypothetical protein
VKIPKILSQIDETISKISRRILMISHQDATETSSGFKMLHQRTLSRVL